MAFRYSLVHHPHAAADFAEAVAFFESVDEDLAVLFKEDFQTALYSLATGRGRTALYAAGHAIRWIKLKRFSHKVFFEPEGEDIRFVLAVVSGRRHPHRIQKMLEARRLDEGD